MTQRNPFFAAVYLLLRKGDRILLADRINTGYCDGQWSLVAGHIEAGESAFAALQREAREEAGIEVAQKDLRVVHVMHRNAEDAERFDIFIEALDWVGTPTIAEPDKCAHMEWVLITDLPKTTIDYITKAIECILKDKNYSEYGW